MGSVIDLAELLARYVSRCAYCGGTIERASATRDHDIPRSRGGSKDLGNIVLACSACNSAKEDMTGAEFREFLITGALPESYIEHLTAKRQHLRARPSSASGAGTPAPMEATLALVLGLPDDFGGVLGIPQMGKLRHGQIAAVIVGTLLAGCAPRPVSILSPPAATAAEAERQDPCLRYGTFGTAGYRQCQTMQAEQEEARRRAWLGLAAAGVVLMSPPPPPQPAPTADHVCIAANNTLYRC